MPELMRNAAREPIWKTCELVVRDFTSAQLL